MLENLLRFTGRHSTERHACRLEDQIQWVLELKGDQKLVFHDEGQAPPGVDAKGTLGVTFMISEADKKPDATEPTTEPAPETPAPSP